MEILRCKDEQEIVQRAYDWCQSQIEQNGASSIYVPAGNTPIQLYRLWEKQRPAYLKGIRLHQIDDVHTGPKQGMFRRFLEQHLPSFQEQIDWINDAPRQADLAILGLGLNGHVAFHEPGLPSHFNIGCVRLDESTTGRLEMSKTSSGSQADTWGITYGLGSFMKSKAILMMVAGSSKQEIFDRFNSDDTSFPAALLKTHKNLTVFAAEELV